jgi:hypothetical protein
MTAPAKHSPVRVRLSPTMWFRAIASGIFLSSVLLSGSATAQSAQGLEGQAEPPSSIHGTVLNRITHEPISRALVYSTDQQYATLTDDRGHFEFKFPPQEPEPQDGSYVVRGFRRFPPNYRPAEFQARKPGFLQSENTRFRWRAAQIQSEITIYLDPESLIVGHVNIPGSENDTRILLELYRREIREGQEHWAAVKSSTTWADGEFRFFDLLPGTYKLITHEHLGRDAFTAIPGGKLLGYPPVFYPGAPDFSAASPIELAAGTTFQANFSPTAREYYPVKISVGNAAAGQSMNIIVYPLGHPGPGYSLGYNPAEQLIQGTLPDGNYTLQLNSQGQPGASGILNFSVRGAPLEGPTVNLIPNASLTVNVREEFSSGQSVFDEGSEEPAQGTFRKLRRINVQVMLTPLEDFGSAQGGVSQPMEGVREHALLIPNVSPGRYRVRVEPGLGFAASVLSGGTDLLRQPLVIGMGGSSSPIEVTLRDDGAEVTGTVEDPAKKDRGPGQTFDFSTQYHVYFVPVAGSTGQFRQTIGGPDGAFTQQQLPPGAYRVLAFDRAQEDLAYATEEALRKYESKAQVIHVTAAQKERLRLKLITESDSQ